MKQLSIIIAHYNDVETLQETLKSLYDTIDVTDFEVIVVNDGSTHSLPSDYKIPDNMRYIEHFVNLGVGQSFDSGVRLAKSDNIILMGADIQFKNNGWASRMLQVLSREKESFIATACGSTKTDAVHYGADVIFLIRSQDLGKQHKQKHNTKYRSVLEGKWRPRTDKGVYPVPCLMGAFYGVTKSFYNKVGGFRLHYKWGTLEPYVSLKAWTVGGSVLVDSENTTYHVFARSPQREALWDVLAYNQLMTANAVFKNYGIKYANFLYETNDLSYQMGSRMMMEKIEAITQLTHHIDLNRVAEPQEVERAMVELSYHYNQKDCKYINPLNN